MRVIEFIADNFKRLRAVRIILGDGVTPIVGPNGAGKTSVLDALAAALGGAAVSPEVPIRRGAERAEVVVDLGDIKVRRRWTHGGSTLEVVSSEGVKLSSPQAVLDKLVGRLSFDPLEFSRQKPSEQAETLAKVAGVDLAKYQVDRKRLYDERTHYNRQAKDARAALERTPPMKAPDAEVSIAELVKELEQAEGVNREKVRLGEVHNAAVSYEAAAKLAAERAASEVDRLTAELQKARTKYEEATAAFAEKTKRTDETQSARDAATTVDTAPIRERLASAEQSNRLVRAKRERDKAVYDATMLERKADFLTTQIERADADLQTAVATANLPVPGLTLQPEGVRLNGIPFGQCSGAEKLRVSVALGIALNPTLRLMLIRDGSLLDSSSMKLLADMADKANAQVLIERVEATGEVGVRIEDGEVVEVTERGAA
jgi:DNA repair ATPase RecN